MNVRLSPEHEKWLADRVAAGEFPYAAVAAAIDGLTHLADDDLAWARPYIDKADASLARGDGIPGDRFLAALDRKIQSLR
jgi:Arc/MetJ-type ribon-helix-helix transcriptional regulator